MNKRNSCFLYATVLLTLFSLNGHSQESSNRYKKEFYFSWGYNTEIYTRSNVKINQPVLNNKYEFLHVKGHDHKGWDEGLFHKDLTIPQYNYRLGFFFNKKKDLAFEINFDHTKFIITDGQTIRIKGSLNGKNLDSIIVFSQANGFYYYLNNGANFLLFNLVKRWSWLDSKKSKFKLDALTKAGIGPVIPHVENSFFGNANDADFQLGGWNAGIEGDIRATFLNHLYLEFAGKFDYASYSHLHIYKGYAKQAFGTAEIILSLGYTFKSHYHSKK